MSRATEHPPRIAAEIVRDPAAFDTLEREWDALLDARTTGSYFLRPHWNRSWWRHCAPPDSSLRLVACRTADGRLVGVAPCYLSVRRVLGIAAARELRWLGTGIRLKTSEALDLVAAPGLEAPVARAVAECLAHDRGWDRAWLFQVPQDAEATGHLASALGQVRTTECDRAPFIDTSVDWATLKAGYGRSMRRNMEYYARRLFKTYACSFAAVSERAEVEPALTAMIQLHQTSWRSRGESGAFAEGPLEALLRDVAEEAFARGHLRLWVLRIDGRIEGALIGFLDHGVLHYLQKGFNPAFAKDDLGTVLLSLCVKACVEDPAVQAFDLMGGGAPYKEMWARAAVTTVVHEMVRPSWRSLLVSGREGAVTATTQAYRALAPAWLRRARRDRIRRQQRERVEQTG